MLEFNDEVLQFKLRDEVIELRIPYVHELSRYDRELSKIEKGQEFDFVMKFLVGLGLPEDCKLQTKQLNKIIEAFTAKK
jgi:hypothetical protein